MLPTPPASPKPFRACQAEDRLGQILAGRIRLTEILGVGAYGTVYQARDVESDVLYAVKALNKVGLDARQKQFQDREIQLHYQASEHRNVVSMVKILDSPDCTYVVLEYCPEGDLFAKITEEGHYVGDYRKAKYVFLQILDAVSHCHAKGVYHRDLKPENILVKDDGWTVKLADFGLATQETITTDFGCGSTFYMSPECLRADPKPYACFESAPNDVWSLGVILVNLTCGRNPWKRAAMDDSTFRAFMKDRNFLRSILPISDELNFILQRIFEVNPQRRITLPELRQLIVQCPALTQGPTANASPLTPPYTPVDSPIETPFATCGAAAEVPSMEPLPGLQYPPMSGPQTYTQPAPLATPPESNNCSPQHSVFTYAARPAAPLNPAYLGSYGYMPAAPVWPRCGQFMANLHIPRPNCLWNAPIY